MGQGYYYNWQKAGASVLQNPLYVLYSNQHFSDIDPGSVLESLALCKANTESAEIVAYLVWVHRNATLFQ